MPDVEEESILDGVSDLIDLEFGLEIGKTRRHKNETSFRELATRPMVGFEVSGLIEKIYVKIGENWRNSACRRGSKDNWRFDKQPNISVKNRSPEVILEKSIVNIPDEIWSDARCWMNQVPVASGLTRRREGRRAIDLVHRCPDGWYEFIELKVNGRGGSPLFAAMEILQYGVLYIFSRQNAKDLGYTEAEKPLLGATGIHLRVMAPATYYALFDDLSWLEEGISKALAIFLAQPRFAFKLAMDFEFETLWLIPSRSHPVTWKV
ncbi:MAG: hypothetical protein EPO29_06220 [Betaproteobacteria bacterium]|nr:MAG: hypothetical protein EPO29_06220 [Betaproteobacteria bacterium]